MNHNVIEPEACTPAPGWEKGQVEIQTQFLCGEQFCPKLAFDDLDALNARLRLRSVELANVGIPISRIAEVFADDLAESGNANNHRRPLLVNPSPFAD